MFPYELDNFATNKSHKFYYKIIKIIIPAKDFYNAGRIHNAGLNFVKIDKFRSNVTPHLYNVTLQPKSKK